MKWLLGLIRKVGRFLANSIRAFGLLAGRLFVNAVNQISVGISAGFPLAVVTFELDLAYFTDNNKWEIFKRFTDAILEETEKLIE